MIDSTVDPYRRWQGSVALFGVDYRPSTYMAAPIYKTDGIESVKVMGGACNEA